MQTKYDEYGHAGDLKARDYSGQYWDELACQLGRLRRMILRNLKALHDWKAPPTPPVNIASAHQVNVAKRLERDT